MGKEILWSLERRNRCRNGRNCCVRTSDRTFFLPDVTSTGRSSNVVTQRIHEGQSMSDNKSEKAAYTKCHHPHVLVIHKDEAYGQSIAAALSELSMCSKHIRTIDAFLDLNCRVRVDLVALEIDVLDPNSLDCLRLARTHFGEGPGTRIVALTDFAPGALSSLLEQRGADAHVIRQRDATAMAIILAPEIRTQLQ